MFFIPVVHGIEGGQTQEVIEDILVQIQLCSKLFNPPDIFPLISIVNKSSNIECCVNTILPIIQNLIVSQGLELILSMCRRTTMSGEHPLI